MRQRTTLRRQEDPVPPAAQPASQQFLALPAATALSSPPLITVRGVDERSADLQVAVENAHGVTLAGRVAHLHGAQRERTDLPAGPAQFHRLHAVDAMTWSAL